MKKLSILLNLLLIGFIAFQSCGGQNQLQSSNEYSCNNSGAFDGITLAQAKMMVRNYRDHHLNQIKIRNTPGLDSRSVWFSLKRLKQFIYEIESNAHTRCNNPNRHDSLGVRIYYGEYPEDVDWMNFALDTKHPASYKGLHTLLMVPTYFEDGFNYDFEPTKVKNCGFMPLDQSVVASGDLAITDTNVLRVLVPDYNPPLGGGGTGSTTMNDGTLIPPPYQMEVDGFRRPNPNGQHETIPKIKIYPCTGAKLMQIVDIGDKGKCGDPRGN